MKLLTNYANLPESSWNFQAEFLLIKDLEKLLAHLQKSFQKSFQKQLVPYPY